MVKAKPRMEMGITTENAPPGKYNLFVAMRDPIDTKKVSIMTMTIDGQDLKTDLRKRVMVMGGALAEHMESRGTKLDPSEMADLAVHLLGLLVLKAEKGEQLIVTEDEL